MKKKMHLLPEKRAKKYIHVHRIVVVIVVIFGHKLSLVRG